MNFHGLVCIYMSVAYIDHIIGTSPCTAFYVHFIPWLLYPVLSSPLFFPLWMTVVKLVVSKCSLSSCACGSSSDRQFWILFNKCVFANYSFGSFLKRNCGFWKTILPSVCSYTVTVVAIFLCHTGVKSSLVWITHSNFVACSMSNFKKGCDQIPFYKVYVPVSCKYILNNTWVVS